MDTSWQLKWRIIFIWTMLLWASPSRAHVGPIMAPKNTLSPIIPVHPSWIGRLPNLNIFRIGPIVGLKTHPKHPPFWPLIFGPLNHGFSNPMDLIFLWESFSWRYLSNAPICVHWSQPCGPYMTHMGCCSWVTSTRWKSFLKWIPCFELII